MSISYNIQNDNVFMNDLSVNSLTIDSGGSFLYIISWDNRNVL